MDGGGKAKMLARMRARGLRVPDGVVVLPGERVDRAAVAALGDRLVARSSASLEDGAAASFAGLFETIVDVRASEVEDAVERVRASADSAAVRAYLAAKELTAPAMAVLVQPLVVAERYGVAHGSAAGFSVEERAPGEPEYGEVRAYSLPADAKGALADGLRACAEMLGGPVDVEFARSGDDVTFLQARPLVAAPSPTSAPELAEPGLWTLDAEHNPDPLSPAQASLVAFVDTLGVGARLRVIGDYLYVRRDPVSELPRAVVPAPELRRRFDDDILPDCMGALATAEADRSLDAARAAYGHVYRRYVGEVSPSLAAAKAALDRFLHEKLGEPLGAHAVLFGDAGGATLARCQMLYELGRGRVGWPAYLERFGDYAPAWDVAVPTDREAGDRVREQAAALARAPVSPAEKHGQARAAARRAEAALAARLPIADRGQLAELVRLLGAVMPLAEDDDLLFLRAQATVRRALLRDGPIEPARPARSPPPSAYLDGVPMWRAPRAAHVLVGAGTSGHARGRAFVVRALADAPANLPAGAILVAPAIVPSLAPLLVAARALVTAHGGALSHGATLARELGIPAVLGVHHAVELADGAELYVDADRGRVYVL